MNLKFRRVAIVNRGEPAMRLLHAVREINQQYGTNLRTIALYTEPDRQSMFVRESDEAVCLGPATFVDSRDGQRKSKYLDYEALEEALTAGAAEAAWVGWGFVAEHAEFADLCERLGVVFIGPTGDVMRRVGDKIQSKLLAERAGVPVVPWTGGPVETPQEALAFGSKQGFPLIIKATAGGGGRGVRRVNGPETLEEAFLSARSEALKFFGSATVFLEKAVVGARHVEVQVLADHHGTSWAVGVRDCTIQRRNQKVVEEAPSVALDEKLDREIRAAAVRLSTAAGYRNAGTVEFLFDPKTRAFYFMEMNTRLQVEHPVTEVTTGLDLVKMQFHIAGGGRLQGEAPRTVGHAIEVRLNAEDADNNFAPAPGLVELFQVPTGPGVRVDTGVRQGDVVSSDFDSMIAKLIAYGADRNEALGRLRRALLESAVVIRGGTSNKAFLLGLLMDPDVVSGNTDIGWLDRVSGAKSRETRPWADIAIIQAALDVYDRELAIEKKNFFVSAAKGRPKVRSEVGQALELRYDGQPYKLDVRRVGGNQYRVYVEGQRIDVVVDRQGEFERWLTCAGARHRVVSVVDGVHHLVEVDGIPHRISRDEGGVVRAPSPAVTLAIHVQPGDVVAEGDRLLVLEAMKMEMAVVAPCGGRVRKVLVRPNMQVNAGAPLVLLEPEAEAAGTKPKEQVKFLPDTPRQSAEGKAAREQCEVLDELRRMMLGYDIDAKEAKALLKEWSTARGEVAIGDQDMWDGENQILEIFSDISLVHSQDPNGAGEQPVGAEENLHAYLRASNAGAKGLPSAFVDKMQRALRHYGIPNLDPCPELDEALLFIHKSYRRIDQLVQHVFGFLEYRLQHADELTDRATAGLRDLLDRVITATQDQYLPVNDLARELRFRLFDRMMFEKTRTESYRQVRDMMLQLVENPGRSDRGALMEALVKCPHSLQGYLSDSFAGADLALRRLSVELILRRMHRIRRLESVHAEESQGHSVVTARYEHGRVKRHVVATHATCANLGAAIDAVGPVFAELEHAEHTSLDLYVSCNGGPIDAEQSRQSVAEALRATKLCRSLDYVCVALSSTAVGRPIRYFTFVPGEKGYEEHRVYPGMHPMIAERLEVWRLENFKTEQLPAPEHIYLFHAVARDNPKDERLFSFVDVRDMTPARNDAGHAVELPHLEHLFLEALAGIREFQARRSTRDRLHWNRVLLYLWPAAELTPQEMMRIAKRLAPTTKNLGLEKLVVRMRLRDETSGDLVERVLHISNRAGTGLRMQFDKLSDQPVRPLTPYAQKVIQMRRLQLIYPYEIVRMLTPSREGDQAEFPPGDFTEYDLDEQHRLVPVQRAPGKNTANVIVGVIRNSTPKHPEGMTRVMLLGDGSREMGALAEPECRRIILAVDLAQQLGVPLEWFPVSSGAKIAMDVGTEGLDWIARVLRRLVEFTQDGGEVNVVVSGVNVGGQSYWNAEATMLMHTRGILVMTPQASMVLTGKRALDYSGGVSADTNQGIGGVERIMGPNGEAQYAARDIAEACHILFRHYDHTYVAPGERFPRRAPTADPSERDVRTAPHQSVNGSGFEIVGDVLSAEKNPGRKKPFDIRSVMRAVIDQDREPLERWLIMRNAETAVIWDAHLGGIPACTIGIESRPLPRIGVIPGDGPDSWTGGTLFPQSSKKVARAINAASGNRPVVVLANLSGFDGSPESMRDLQLEFGAEIGRAVVNFDGPMVFCVISRYHGGAYVVFSCTLNENLEVAAVEGSHASVIGGAPAAAVVFSVEVKARTLADPRVKEVQARLAKASERDKPRLSAHYDEVYKNVFAEKQGEVADMFDGIHSVQRAKDVGSIHHIVAAQNLRPYLISAVERGMKRVLDSLPTHRTVASRHGRIVVPTDHEVTQLGGDMRPSND